MTELAPESRAITVKQPWAWAISAGHKLVENRSRGTKYRGELLIHAGQKRSERGDTDARIRALWGPPGRPSYPRWAEDFGAVIAVVQLVDSHPDAGCCRPWGESSYVEAGGRNRTAVHHLVLEDVRRLTWPVPARGALGLWRPTPELLAAVHAGGTPPQSAIDRHVDAVADTGSAYIVQHRRPWHLDCLWCDYRTTGHPTKRAALGELEEHYGTLVPGWRLHR